MYGLLNIFSPVAEQAKTAAISVNSVAPTQEKPFAPLLADKMQSLQSDIAPADISGSAVYVAADNVLPAVSGVGLLGGNGQLASGGAADGGTLAAFAAGAAGGYVGQIGRLVYNDLSVDAPQFVVVPHTASDMSWQQFMSGDIEGAGSISSANIKAPLAGSAMDRLTDILSAEEIDALAAWFNVPVAELGNSLRQFMADGDVSLRRQGALLLRDLDDRYGQILALLQRAAEIFSPSADGGVEFALPRQPDVLGEFAAIIEAAYSANRPILFSSSQPAAAAKDAVTMNTLPQALSPTVKQLERSVTSSVSAPVLLAAAGEGHSELYVPIEGENIANILPDAKGGAGAAAAIVDDAPLLSQNMAGIVNLPKESLSGDVQLTTQQALHNTDKMPAVSVAEGAIAKGEKNIPAANMAGKELGLTQSGLLASSVATDTALNYSEARSNAPLVAKNPTTETVPQFTQPKTPVEPVNLAAAIKQNISASSAISKGTSSANGNMSNISQLAGNLRAAAVLADSASRPDQASDDENLGGRSALFAVGLDVDSRQKQQAIAADKMYFSGRAENSEQPNMPLRNQVVIHIKQALEDGTRPVRIQLQPAELGRVTIHMELSKDGHTQLLITADNKESLQLLQRDSRQLAAALNDIGLQTSHADMEFSLQGQDAGDSGHGMAEAQADDQSHIITDDAEFADADISGLRDDGTNIATNIADEVDIAERNIDASNRKLGNDTLTAEELLLADLGIIGLAHNGRASTQDLQNIQRVAGLFVKEVIDIEV